MACGFVDRSVIRETYQVKQIKREDYESVKRREREERENRRFVVAAAAGCIGNCDFLRNDIVMKAYSTMAVT